MRLFTYAVCTSACRHSPALPSVQELLKSLRSNVKVAATRGLFAEEKNTKKTRAVASKGTEYGGAACASDRVPDAAKDSKTEDSGILGELMGDSTSRPSKAEREIAFLLK